MPRTQSSKHSVTSVWSDDRDVILLLLQSQEESKTISTTAILNMDSRPTRVIIQRVSEGRSGQGHDDAGTYEHNVR